MQIDSKPDFKKDERLMKVLMMVNDWIKFAEAKNAMLIAFNGASIYGLTKALDLQFFKDHEGWQTYATIFLIMLVFSVVSGLLSFIPQLNVVNLSKLDTNKKTSSIYFMHLKNKSEVEIIQGICETNQVDFSPFELDIAHQIQQNSIIAASKFDFFKIAAWITIISYVHVFAFILAIILWALRKETSK